MALWKAVAFMGTCTGTGAGRDPRDIFGCVISWLKRNKPFLALKDAGHEETRLPQQETIISKQDPSA